MLAQIATALLAFASHHKLEDAKEVPTKSVYATAGTSGAGADPSKRCSEGQHEGMNMDKAACRAACIGTSGCTHAIHFSDNGCQISTKGCTLVSHSYGADTDEIFALPPECAQPMWKSVPSGTKDNPASGWSRMEGGGQGPGGTDAKGCFDSPQGYTYVTSPAQPCESGYFWNNDDGRTCDAGGCNAGEAGTCTCEHGACPAGYLRNTGGVPSGWDPWGSRRRYPYPKGDYYPSDCPCKLSTCEKNYHVSGGKCVACPAGMWNAAGDSIRDGAASAVELLCCLCCHDDKPTLRR